MADTLRALADHVAGEQATRDLVDLFEKHGHSSEYEMALAGMKKRIEKLVEDVWGSKPEFAEAVRLSLGSDLALESLAELILRYYSHSVEYEELPPSQVWIVDSIICHRSSPNCSKLSN